MLSTSPLRRTAAAAAALVALVLAAFVLAAAPASAVLGSIPLHNDAAPTTTDCPADGAAYWHFVLAPNDGSSAFVTIVLHLDDDLVTFQGQAIVPNAGQTDNVYVGVPTGHTLGSLRAEGSYATFEGGDPNNFNLSHVCEGTVPPTTPPTVPPTTPPTVPPTTPPTVPPTQPTVVPTTPEVEVLGASTVNPGVAVQPAELPYTGSDELGLAAVGLAVAGAGFALASIARRRQQA